MRKQKIVILGSGFAGVNTFLSLIKKIGPNDAEVLFINKTNHFTFTPLLHEVATGGLGSNQTVESVRDLICKTRGDVLVAEVQKIDFDQKVVYTSVHPVSYDILVIATGAETNFYGIEGAEKYSLVLKDLADSLKMRNRFITVFEEASRIENDEARREKLSFAVIGGGPTGVELVAEMADLFFHTFCRYYHGKISPNDISLYLVNKGAELMPDFEKPLRNRAERVLRRQGVTLLLEKDVVKIDDDEIFFADGNSVFATTIVWVAGVKPIAIEMIPALEKDRGGRILVDEFLRVRGKSNVFALGDTASFVPSGSKADSRPLPMLAQVAMRQGVATGNNIAAVLRNKPLTKFVYKSKGTLVSLGQWQAVGSMIGLVWFGPMAWLVWRGAYLFNFASWPKRIKIAVDWTVGLFSPRDITKA